MIDGCVTGATGGSRSVQQTGSTDTDQLPSGSVPARLAFTIQYETR